MRNTAKKRRSIARRLAQIVAGGALSFSLTACTCPPPLQLDQVFLLDASAGSPVVVDAASFDAMSIAPGDAAAGDAAPKDEAVSDAAAGDAGKSTDPSGPYSPPLDCTSAASRCTPGADCLEACNCVLARNGVMRVIAIDSCKLLVGGAPSVEVRYEVNVQCPGGA